MELANKKHLSLADRHFLRRSRCGYIGRSPLVCCVKQQQKTEEIAAWLSGSPIHLDDLSTDCGQADDIFNQNSYVVEYFIVGGGESRIGDSPWLALLQYQKSMFLEMGSNFLESPHPCSKLTRFLHFFLATGLGFYCGGVLINKDYVLTGNDRFKHSFQNAIFRPKCCML